MPGPKSANCELPLLPSALFTKSDRAQKMGATVSSLPHETIDQLQAPRKGAD